MAGFGEGDGVVHGFAVANLADQNHVRRLTQGVFQRREPVFGVHPDLALGDDAVLVVVHVFDRVLDGDDVAEAVFVAVADHRRQRGGFARAGAADENHQTALGHGHVLEHFRQAQFLELGNFGGDGAQHQADARLLHEGIDAKTADIRRADGEIAFLGGLELRRLLAVHDRHRQFLRMGWRKGLVGNRRHLAVHLDGGWKAGGNEQVGTFLAEHQPQQIMHEFLRLFAFHGFVSRLKWILSCS